jgi:hypothetical protein
MSISAQAVEHAALVDTPTTRTFSLVVHHECPCAHCELWREADSSIKFTGLVYEGDGVTGQSQRYGGSTMLTLEEAMARITSLWAYRCLGIRNSSGKGTKLLKKVK